jgi:hypothetical protein
MAVNEVTHLCRTIGLDFYQQTGSSQDGWKSIDGELQPPVDLVLAADMICQPSDAVYAANTICDALASNGKAFVVCADGQHRFGVDCFVSECRRVGLLVQDEHLTDTEYVQGLDLEKTSGFVSGMNLILFSIQKR